jgi:rSAM/selenodomain-associated transferase 2
MTDPQPSVRRLRVSVIIPTLNEASYIARAIDRAWDLRPHEVIVVDGGSHDGTQDLARSRRCTLLEVGRTCEAENSRHAPPAAETGIDSAPADGPRSVPAALAGRAFQQNLGAQQSAGEVLLFLHADTWLDPAGNDQIEQALSDPQVAGGGFQQHIEAAGRVYRLLEWGNALRVRRWGMAYGDQGIFVRRELFERLGGFPAVKLMEDWLFMRKLRRAGRILLLPGPLHISPRRWQKHGIVRQTLRNGCLLAAASLGVSPNRLARYYRRHDR